MRLLRHILAALAALAHMQAAEHRGVVKFGGLPLPGATITAQQGEKRLAAISDAQGFYVIPGLADGVWAVQVDMQLFAPARREVTMPSTETAPVEWELTLLPEGELAKLATQATRATAKTAQPLPKDAKATNTATPFQRTDLAAAKKNSAPAAPQAPPQSAADPELAQRAADGLLINGSVNNGALTPFAQLPAFGNNRRGQRSLYNGNLGVIVNNSAFDARNFSLTGQDTPKPAYNRIQALLSFGGPLRIPGIFRRNNGPTFSVNYQWTRNSNASVQTALMPTAAERLGDLSGSPRAVLDPANGSQPFAGNIIPASRISPQARALLDLFPLPNFVGNSRYNFQIPIVSGLHQDDLQTRLSKQIRRNFLSGSFAWQSTRSDTPNLFGFLDTNGVTGINTAANYRYSFSQRTFVNAGVQYSRMSARLNPHFANRANVSGAAGIAGNLQDPVNWGPPALIFSGGIATLSDAQASRSVNQTAGVSADAFMSRDRHNISYGGTYRRQQFNLISQQDPRGTFALTGAATGHDFAGFLLGLPDTSTIAFGNADKYLRGYTLETFVNDDWRVNPGFTINAGVRWEFWSPLEEKYGRLVNLEIVPGFTSAKPIIAGNATSLLQADRNNVSPRIAFSWRPLPASSLVIRGGYGIYYDTSVYQSIALQMAQQAPLSRNLRIANSAATPLTLAAGFPASGVADSTTFAVDPRFRAGYSQNWQFSLQRDLPAGLQINTSYNGGKGTRAQQQFLPNTFPSGADNPCPLCPAGFTYLMSNGNSIRHAGSVQLRRRLRSGIAAQMMYTYAKSIDNAALGVRNQAAALIAQNWLDLSAERARSSFDQRHLLTSSVQYTTGMGLKGGALANGPIAAFLREWTLGTQINAGSGLPLTPVILSPVRGTGVTGSIRPDFTGASIYEAPSGFFLNPTAVATPAAGRWGNAGRNSITGPRQFVMNASLGRTFRGNDRLSYDFRIDASNALNYVTYTAWNTIAGNAQFGLPVGANPMRTVQTTFRMRF